LGDGVDRPVGGAFTLWGGEDWIRDFCGEGVLCACIGPGLLHRVMAAGGDGVRGDRLRLSGGGLSKLRGSWPLSRMTRGEGVRVEPAGPHIAG